MVIEGYPYSAIVINFFKAEVKEKENGASGHKWLWKNRKNGL